MPTIGEIFKQKRLERNLTLGEVSDLIKISGNFLNALENNEFKKLPKGIFPKMFIRSYSKFLQLDENKMVQLFYEQIAVIETVAEAASPVVQRGRDPGSRRSLAPVLAVIAIVVILAFSGYFLFKTQGFEFHSHPVDQARVQTSPPEVKNPVSLPPTEPVAPPAKTDENAKAAEPVPAQNPGQEAQAPATPAGEAAAQEQALNIEIRARQYCWVHISWNTANETDFILKPGDVYQRNFDGPIVLRLGNAGGVALLLNGKSCRSLGGPGEVINLTLSLADLNQYLSDTTGKE